MRKHVIDKSKTQFDGAFKPTVVSLMLFTAGQ
jgi:hypothetical protein